MGLFHAGVRCPILFGKALPAQPVASQEYWLYWPTTTGPETGASYE
ncbi:hypothetical protein [Myxococcus xanthus]|nr:hypothetical protein [Myxococcus xanthus]